MLTTEIVTGGSILMRNGKIADGLANPSARGVDLAGNDFLPGCVELQSDDIPLSLIQAVVPAAHTGRTDLPQAVRLVSHSLARAAGWGDRGRTDIGRRDHLAHVRAERDLTPVIAGICWEGRRVC